MGEQAVGDIAIDLAKTSPYIAGVVFTILGMFFIWSKWGNQAVSCMNCKLKNDFDFLQELKENVGDTSKMTKTISIANDRLELVSKKIDESNVMHKEAFSKLIERSEKQNDVLTKMCTVLDLMANKIL